MLTPSRKLLTTPLNGLSHPPDSPMRMHLKSQFPASNIPHQNEAVATDTIFSAAPASKDSLGSDVYPMQSSEQFANTLEDNIK